MPVKLENILERVQSLPPLPSSAVRIINLTKNPDVSVKDLETVIGHDPALAASILRQANSAYYGYARRISTLGQAIVILGFQSIHGLAMASAVAPALKKSLIGYNIDQEGLWKHSMLTAMISQRMCKRLHLAFGDTAFTAGLLHDIGKLVITLYVQEVGDFIVKKIETNHQYSYAELEEKIIGYDHGVVGGFIAKQWDLPDDLIEAISHHHFPERAVEHPKLTAVVHVANGLATLIGIGAGVDGMLNPISEHAMSILSLKEVDLEYIMAEMGDLLADPSLFS